MKGIDLFARFWFLSRFCLNAQGRKNNFQSLEVRRKLIALKKGLKKCLKYFISVNSFFNLYETDYHTDYKLENQLRQTLKSKWLKSMEILTGPEKGQKSIKTPRGEKINCDFTMVLTIFCQIVALLHTYALFV